MLASVTFAAAITVAFGYGVSTYLHKRPKKFQDDGSDFAYVDGLYRAGTIDEEGFAALVIIANDPDINFIRPTPPTIMEPPKRSLLMRLVNLGGDPVMTMVIAGWLIGMLIIIWFS